MKLLKATIRPGTVLEVFDDGNIKASAPGLFSYMDDTTTMPPIMPWMIGSNSNSYSKPLKYEEVWIMNFSDNPRQLYWFRKDNVKDNKSAVPMGEENVEVLCNREVAGDWATIYFSDGSGWIIGKGESIIQIRPDGSIMLNTDLPNRCIDINAKNISIGSKDKSSHPAAYGDEVESVLRALLAGLQQLALTAAANPFTASLAPTIIAQVIAISGKIPSISSENVTID